MLAAAVVLFREALEIALILSIVLAATRGLAGRNMWALIGVVAGCAGSAIIAIFAETIANAAEGMGQEIFNAAVLLLAAALIGWTVIWMRTHGREISMKMKHVGEAAKKGEVPLYTLAIVIALAFFREGSEVVLFSYGLLASGMSVGEFVGGSLLGLIAGGFCGVLFYYGMLKFLARHFFTVTSWMLILLAAGMVSKAFGFLTAAGYVPELGGTLWDTSSFLEDKSIAGQTLNVLIGYTAQPYGIQLLTYIITIVLIVGGMHIFKPHHTPKPAANQA